MGAYEEYNQLKLASYYALPSILAVTAGWGAATDLTLHCSRQHYEFRVAHHNHPR